MLILIAEDEALATFSLTADLDTQATSSWTSPLF